MQIDKIRYNDNVLFYELNQEFNPKEEINIEGFLDFILNLPKNQEIYVLRDNGHVIGCATLIIEKKLIHNFGMVAHIEDVFIRSQYRNKGYGKYLINEMINKAELFKCYKVILNCSENLKSFYEKNNFKYKNIQMGYYFS
tara:strand:- start:175 stop:594 length:420 start_codon:yes stop_codon:yes gene_type:complete